MPLMQWWLVYIAIPIFESDTLSIYLIACRSIAILSAHYGFNNQFYPLLIVRLSVLGLLSVDTMR